ncbi:16S rRNA (guanine(527)-N(7))-methyltransferase RsmG [Coprothermobacteraceae bacterium]|nr:16S rRNA (guanine(527)-N(7))-methyltransferase RsmG [Coprothermobacteraceae bacterium]
MIDEPLKLFAQRLYHADYLHGYKTLEELWTLGILDALAVLDFAKLYGVVLDIGPGGGLPGLVLAISLPNTRFVMLDSSQKACTFLQSMCHELSLNNVEVVHGRAEEFGKSNREAFDAVVSRAVAETRILVEYAAAPLKLGGTVYLWKGPAWREELERANRAVAELGLEFLGVHRYLLGDKQRVIIALKKIKETPLRYPRKPGIPEKRPL